MTIPRPERSATQLERRNVNYNNDVGLIVFRIINTLLGLVIDILDRDESKYQSERY